MDQVDLLVELTSMFRSIFGVQLKSQTRFNCWHLINNQIESRSTFSKSPFKALSMNILHQNQLLNQ